MKFDDEIVNEYDIEIAELIVSFQFFKQNTNLVSNNVFVGYEKTQKAAPIQ